jgi:cyanate permease
MTATRKSTGNPFRQPRAVWAVAFACVISFMGIGLVDPILPALAHSLHASPSQVSLLFTSYLVVTAVAMLGVGWVSSRIGAEPTLVTGLLLIVVFAALAGASDSIGGIVGFRAGWGLGNALFIATSLAVIVASASGGFSGAIILYETALGIGIAVGPYPMELDAHHLGLVFFAWGLLVALFSVLVAPRLQGRFGRRQPHRGSDLGRAVPGRLRAGRDTAPADPADAAPPAQRLIFLPR